MFAITAGDQEGASRRYLTDTNVIETTFKTRTGKARVLDCFTMRQGGRQRPYRQLLRVVEGIEGKVSFDVLVQPRFDYGELRPWLRYFPKEKVYSAVGGDDAFILSANSPLEIDYEAVCFRGQAFTHMALINSAEQIRCVRADRDHAKALADRAHLHPSHAVAQDTWYHAARRTRP